MVVVGRRKAVVPAKLQDGDRRGIDDRRAEIGDRSELSLIYPSGPSITCSLRDTVNSVLYYYSPLQADYTVTLASIDTHNFHLRLHPAMRPSDVFVCTNLWLACII